MKEMLISLPVFLAAVLVFLRCSSPLLTLGKNHDIMIKNKSKNRCLLVILPICILCTTAQIRVAFLRPGNAQERRSL